MERNFEQSDLNRLEKKYKTNLINSIGGYKSANLIGTINNEGVTNLSIVSSVVHIGAEPPLLGFIMRPISTPRHTYENIKANDFFTVNQIHENITGKAHFASARFDKNESEFEELQLTAEFKKDIKAPFVKESKIKIGLKFNAEHLISNGCKLVIGEIVNLSIEEEALSNNGMLNLEVINTNAISGLNKYYKGKFTKEFPYAKKDQIKKVLGKQRPDNVVYNETTKKYDASLKTYNTNVGAPMIKHNDLSNWKKVGSNKVNYHLKAEFELIKEKYDGVIEIYEWNQKIYDCKFNFEPIVGNVYHLYKNSKQELFLSQLGPHEWNKDHQGTFKLNADRIFIKMKDDDFLTEEGIVKKNIII